MPILFTLGYQGRPLSEFVQLLRSAGVDAVLDVRLRNTSHLAGYTRCDDLAFLLQEGFAIAYEHHPELAASNDILDSYSLHHDWLDYSARFTSLMAERQVQAVAEDIFSRYSAPCLLCYEASPEHCHRRLVAEWWATHMPDLTITHL